jgi:hypothetical protein
LLMTWMGRQFTHRLAGYALLLVGASVLSAVARVAAGTLIGPVNNLSTLVDRAVMLLPISSFWSMISVRYPPPGVVLIPQLAIAVLVLAAAWWRARPYYQLRRVFDAQPTEDPAP